MITKLTPNITPIKDECWEFFVFLRIKAGLHKNVFIQKMGLDW
jgi:hypothetical protein